MVTEPVALSLDAKIAADQWVVLGNEPVPQDVPLPAYKEIVGSPDQVDVVDYSGQRRRRAVGREADLLPNRIVVAPIRLEKALRAMHGLEPWQKARRATTGRGSDELTVLRLNR